MKLLVVEDEPALAEAVSVLLRDDHHTVTVCNNGTDGCAEALSGLYDAVVLDVLLPGMNGFDVLAEMHKAGVTTPVLLLSALSDVASRVKGLDYGAAYYLTKPFEPKELLACLRAITRRTGENAASELTFGDLFLHEESGDIECSSTGRRVHAGQKEFYLLELLVRARGDVCYKDRLTGKIWGYDTQQEYNMLEVYISFLRKKLRFLGSSMIIRSRRGIGYSLEIQS